MVWIIEDGVVCVKFVVFVKVLGGFVVVVGFQNDFVQFFFCGEGQNVVQDFLGQFEVLKCGVGVYVFDFVNVIVVLVESVVGGYFVVYLGDKYGCMGIGYVFDCQLVIGFFGGQGGYDVIEFVDYGVYFVGEWCFDCDIDFGGGFYVQVWDLVLFDDFWYYEEMIFRCWGVEGDVVGFVVVGDVVCVFFYGLFYD